MGRPKEEGQYLNVRIDKGVYDRMSIICEEAGHTKAYVVEKALTSFIEDYEENKEVLQRIKDGSAKLVDAD